MPYRMISVPLASSVLKEYQSLDDLLLECHMLSCDGIEAIWGGEDLPDQIPDGLVQGYHLTFFPDWLDFYREDEEALCRKFGCMETVKRFYGGFGRNALLDQYRADLSRAKALGARYVVFHVSDVSVEEGYTYRWLHSSKEVIEAAVEMINDLLDDQEWAFDFLVENQWWPGFTFTDPGLTADLLHGIHYQRKGIVLDLGHLMNCNPDIRNEREGAAYIHRMLDLHGDLVRRIKGVHLHQSISGSYVNTHTGVLPDKLPEDYFERFGISYGHILKIDRHEPWHASEINSVLKRIQPEYLIHELSASDRNERIKAITIQMNTIQDD